MLHHGPRLRRDPCPIKNTRVFYRGNESDLRRDTHIVPACRDRSPVDTESNE